MKIQVRWMIAGVLAALLLPLPAMADSITPSSVTTTVPLGGTITIDKTVTITQGSPTTSLVDVLFLIDTTGSMGDVITAAKNNATTIMNRVAGLGNVQFGVAHYEDIPVSPYGSFGDTPYEVVQGLTSSTALITTALGSLTASGGYDTPEADLYALTQAANSFVWRTDSSRIVVWIGDAPGHDPALEPAYNTAMISQGLTPSGLTNTMNSLINKNITVEAINFSHRATTWTPAQDLNMTGQAGTITKATGGAMFSGTTSSEIATIISEAIITSFDKYTSVGLVAVGNDGTVAFSPDFYVGTFDRSVDRTFTFTMTYTATTPGTDSFFVDALVDGGLAATETDTITVPGASVPEPSSLILLGTGVLGLAVFSRRRSRKN